MNAPNARFRLAPTPSGYLHSGNGLNFVLTWLLARASGAKLRLRIDDLDALRVQPAYIEDIFFTLEYLGLDWDEGPQTPTEHERFYSQRLRIPRYQDWIERLAAGGHLFACACSRREIQLLSPNGQYPGTCRNKGLPLHAPDCALRLLTPNGVTASFDEWRQTRQTVELFGENRDFVVRRRDGLPAYHLASLADDVDYGVTFIVRGADLRPSTAAQVFLAQQLNETAFQNLTFFHHPLITAPNGQKLSKSEGAPSLKFWRENGLSPTPVYQTAAQTLGADSKIDNLADLLAFTQTLIGRL